MWASKPAWAAAVGRVTPVGQVESLVAGGVVVPQAVEPRVATATAVAKSEAGAVAAEAVGMEAVVMEEVVVEATVEAERASAVMVAVALGSAAAEVVE